MGHTAKLAYIIVAIIIAGAIVVATLQIAKGVWEPRVTQAYESGYTAGYEDGQSGNDYNPVTEE